MSLLIEIEFRSWNRNNSVIFFVRSWKKRDSHPKFSELLVHRHFYYAIKRT